MTSIRPLFSNYEETDSDQEGWKNEFVRLAPGTFWAKPPKKMVVLTNVSISCTERDPDNAKGVFVADMWDSSVSLAVLLKNRPSQVMNLVWRIDQNVNFVNKGNHPITISLLTKVMSI